MENKKIDMDMDMDKDFILKIDKRVLDLCWRSKKQREKHKEIIEPLNNFYHWCKSFSEVYYLVTREIYEPINNCSAIDCNELTNYKSFSYNKFCSWRCSSKSVSKESTNKRKISYKKTMLEKYGVDNYYKSKEFNEFRFSSEKGKKFEEIRKEKVKETMNRKFGGDSPFCDQNIKKKAENTTEKNFGHRSYFSSDHYKENREKYFTEEVKQKQIKNMILTLREKHNDPTITSPWSIPEVREKIKKTCKERYGYEWPMQNYDSYMKNQHSCFALKEYIDRFGNIHYIQGYEPQVFEILENKGLILESDCDLIPEIILSSGSRYYPDLFDIKNKVIYEIKSRYTYSESREKKLPMCYESCSSLGFEFVVVIYEPKDNSCEFITNGCYE